MKEILNQIHREIKEENSEVRLMAVSKTHPYCAIEEAYKYGERLFGESKVQEVESKFPEKSERPSDLELHLIGHLQSNKTKKAVKLFDSIDSVDSIKLIKLIDKYSKENGLIMPILLEYNTSGDLNKSGFDSYTLIEEALQLSKELSNIEVKGLMTIGPLGGSEEDVKNAFILLQTIKIKLEKEVDIKLPELSMGMSGDYKDAIECGSTLIRVGTKIFGNRDYSKH